MENTGIEITDEMLQLIRDHSGAYILGASFSGKTTMANEIAKKLSPYYADANGQESINYIPYIEDYWDRQHGKIKIIDNFSGRRDAIGHVASFKNMFDNTIKHGIILVCSCQPYTKVTQEVKNRLQTLYMIKLPGRDNEAE